MDGEPPHITLSVLGISPRLTFAHEWGHYIDNFISGFDGWTSTEGDEFRDILEAVKNTLASQALQREYNANPMRLTPERIEAVRLMNATELWARAYAQYIALRSNDLRMIEEVAVRRVAQQEVHPSLEYWDWNDFIPVAQAIDRWMSQKGWRS